jgi:hypothetical protein
MARDARSEVFDPREISVLHLQIAVFGGVFYVDLPP